MLANHYNDIVVGQNYVSLIVAINKVRSRRVLVIDEPNVVLGRGWYQYIGETEKYLLELIGLNHKIDALKYINSYLTQINTIIYLNDKIIELGSSPADNIRELLRKLPELFGKELMDMLHQIEPASFNQHCLTIFQNLANEASESGKSLTDCFGKLTADPVLKGLYSNILSSFKGSKNNLKAKQFNFVLQVLFQTLFSNSGSVLESMYLMTSILSPRYRVNEEKLVEDLTFEFKQLGGSLKRSKIQDWEIYKGNLNYLLLESYEGVIGLDNLYFFGRLPETVPFHNKFNDTIFNSIEIKVTLGDHHLKSYLNKRVIFSWSDYLGSDSPHWEAYIDQDGTITGIYSYANYEGSKPDFYYNEAMRVFYQSIQKLLPDLSLEEFQFNCQMRPGRDLWMESRKAQKSLSLADKSSARLYSTQDGAQVKGLEYWGPLKAKSLGLFSYLLDLKSNRLA